MLLSSLDRPDSRLDRLWLSESQHRLQAYLRGELEAIPAERVVEELRYFSRLLEERYANADLR